MARALRRVRFLSLAGTCLWAVGCFVTFEDYPAAASDAGGGLDAGSGGNAGGGGTGGGGGAGGTGAGGSGASAGAAGQGADASPADASTDSGAGCPGGLVAISDDFEDGNLADDPDWILFNLGISASETTGNLSLVWPSASVAGWAGGISSKAVFDFRNCGAIVQVLQLPGNVSGAYVRFGIEVSQGNSLDVIAQDGMIYARMLVNGEETTQPTFYDSAEHAWWRLREANGIFHWEASGDGATWKPLRTPQTITLAIDAARLVVGGGTNASSAPAGAARLDNVNRPPPAQEPL